MKTGNHEGLSKLERDVLTYIQASEHDNIVRLDKISTQLSNLANQLAIIELAQKKGSTIVSPRDINRQFHTKICSKDLAQIINHLKTKRLIEGDSFNGLDQVFLVRPR